MFVLTLDQIGSRTGGDLVPEILERYDHLSFVRALERTAGDEVQCVIDDPATVRSITVDLLRDGRWHIGIGAGAVELGDTARSGSGPAYLHAREAVEAAKALTRFTPSVAIRGDHRSAREAESLARLLGTIIGSRTSAQWEAIDALRAGETPAQIAHRLAISVEAVSQRRGHGAQVVEEACWPLLDRLLGEAG